MSPVTLKSLESAKVSLMMQLPLTLKSKLDKEAEQLEIGSASLARQIIAEHYGETVEDIHRGRAKVYNTPEERRNAQKARDKARRDLVKQLMDAYNEGGESAAQELLNQLQAEADSDTE